MQCPTHKKNAKVEKVGTEVLAKEEVRLYHLACCPDRTFKLASIH